MRLAESVIITYLIHFFIMDLSKDDKAFVILITFSMNFLIDFITIMARDDKKYTNSKS